MREQTEDAAMDINMKEVDKLSLKSLFEEALTKEKFTFDVLEFLMEEFFNVYYKVEPGHSRWNPRKGCAVAFGGYSRGAFSGISNATEQFEFLVRYVNGFFKSSTTRPLVELHAQQELQEPAAQGPSQLQALQQHRVWLWQI